MTLEVRVVAAGDVDAVIAELGHVRLERSAGRLLLTCDRVPMPDARALLARAGLEITPATPAGVSVERPAVMSHLRPITVEGVTDVVTVRSAPLGEAIDLVFGATRGLLRRRSPDRRKRVVSLLAERDRVLLWRRVMYAPAALLRSRQIQGARPVVFDPEGARRAPERLTFTSAGEFARWIRS